MLPPDIAELTVLLVELEAIVEEAPLTPLTPFYLSFSISFNLENILSNFFYLSSSATTSSLTLIVLFLLAKFDVPGRPEKSQLIPRQCYLKLL